VPSFPALALPSINAAQLSKTIPESVSRLDMMAPALYTAFHIKLPFLELDYTASAKCRDRHFAPLNG
jgi:hypothetical protein